MAGIGPGTATDLFRNFCSRRSSSLSRSSRPRWSVGRSRTGRDSRRGWCSSRSGRLSSTRSSPTGSGRRGWLLLGAPDYAGPGRRDRVGRPALALALVLGPRIGFKVDAMRPHNLPFVLLGVGLLWFGWFGFNAGSALAANGMASAIFLNTLVAGCLGMLGWLSVERVRDGRPTTFGAASGVVAGLVAITPSCGTVNTLGAAIVGLAAGIVCSFAIGLKFRFGYDDSLDVVGVHFVGGVVGVLLIGFLADAVMTGGPEGLFHGGGVALLGKQALAMVAVAAYAFGMSFALAKLIDRVMGFRLSPEDETAGVDFTQHAETAYAEGVHGHQMSHRPLFDATQRRRAPSDRGVPLKQRLRGSL